MSDDEILELPIDLIIFTALSNLAFLSLYDMLPIVLEKKRDTYLLLPDDVSLGSSFLAYTIGGRNPHKAPNYINASQVIYPNCFI